MALLLKFAVTGNAKKQVIKTLLKLLLLPV